MIDVCKGLTDKLSELNSQFDQLLSLNSINSDLFDTVLNSVPADIVVPTNITSSLNDNISALLTSMDEIQAYTGSCLDGVRSLMDDILNDIYSITDSMFGAISDISSDLLALLQGMASFIGNCSDLVISFLGLLPGLDTLLGCLASSSCLSTVQIQVYFDKIDGLEDILPIDTINYTLDTNVMTTHLTTKINTLPISALKITNLTSISEEMSTKIESTKELVVEKSVNIKKSLESVSEIDVTAVPSYLY